jgi:hypothetical protein
MIDLYKAMAKCNLGDGKSAFFWSDLWLDTCLQQKFPHLLSFAKKATATITEIVNTEFLEDLFHLPLSQQAFQELSEFKSVGNQALLRIAESESDSWSYIWGNNTFSVNKAYKLMCGSQPTPPHFSWIWNSSCQARHKFFFWLLLLDRLNTRNLLGRKQFHLPLYACATLQCNEEETLIHLFWACPFAENCWNYVCSNRGRNLSVLESIEDLKRKIHLPFAMELIIIAAWSIWIVRNDMIFNNKRPTFSSWKVIYLKELLWLSYRMKKKHAETFKAWLQSQV